MHVQAVSNTSPLLNLAIIGQLHLLFLQFEKIYIPRGVHAELRLGTTLPGTALLEEAIKDGLITTVEVKNNHLVQALQSELDKGEAEAITLALEQKIKWILIDETDGRQMAKLMDLQPTGVLGILLQAKKEGQIPEILPLMIKLREEAGFFIASHFFNQILEEAGCVLKSKNLPPC